MSYVRSSIESASLAIVLVVGGCKSELAHDLDEAEANRVVSALAERGIAAEIVAEGNAQERSWLVTVPATEHAKARLVLREQELPSEPERGLAEVFDRSGLIPTPTEEQALLVRALQGELVKTLESVDHVVSARVHLSIDESRGRLIPMAESASASTASVLIRYAGDAPPLNEEQVKSLVAGGVGGLSSENVTVLSLRQARRASDAPHCELVPIGPFAVSPRSLTLLRLWLVSTTLVIALLALALVLLSLRLRTARRKLVTDAAK